MTIVIAYKDSEGVVLGSDTMLSFGDNALNLKRPKWIKFDKFAIAFAGAVAGYNVLERLRADQDFKSLGVQNRKAIDRIVMALRAYMIEEGFTGSDDVGVKTDNAFLLVTEDRLFLICADFSWIDAGEYMAIGCGSEIAMGALVSLNGIEMYQGHSKIDTKLKVGLAMKAASQLNKSCGGDIIVKHFREIRNR